MRFPHFDIAKKGRVLRRMEGGSQIFLDPRDAARQADLVYVTDEEPGIRRLKHGRGFRLVDAEGRRINAPEDLSRVRALAIPPAWSDVWISADPDAHIQATGRDVKGRKQYRYHPVWTACRDEAKFSTLAAFGKALPKLRARVASDLRKRSLARERVIASVVLLLDDTMIRIGNEAYARENRSFGLTTLRQEHVDVEGTQLRFAFRGKSGQEWNVKLRDRRLASVMRSLQELPGQKLFQYQSEDGPRPVHSHDVNDYIRDAMEPEFSTKHFRTWGATKAAAFHLSQIPLPETKRQQTIALNACIDKVARRLHNTRTVCRRCYIHPQVTEGWLAGRLEEEMRELSRRYRRAVSGLDREETILLRWLEGQAG